MIGVVLRAAHGVLASFFVSAAVAYGREAAAPFPQDPVEYYGARFLTGVLISGTREIAEYGGLLRVMPLFTIVFLITALSSMGMPPLNGFIGEITILQGAYQVSIGWAFWVVLGIAIGAAYLIWLFQRTMLGEVSEKNSKLMDLSPREIAVFAPLLVWTFWIGLYPKPFFQVLERPVAQIVERVRPGYHAEHKLPNPLETAPAAGLRQPGAPVQ